MAFPGRFVDLRISFEETIFLFPLSSRIFLVFWSLSWNFFPFTPSHHHNTPSPFPSSFPPLLFCWECFLLFLPKFGRTFLLSKREFSPLHQRCCDNVLFVIIIGLSHSLSCLLFWRRKLRRLLPFGVIRGMVQQRLSYNAAKLAGKRYVQEFLFFHQNNFETKYSCKRKNNDIKRKNNSFCLENGFTDQKRKWRSRIRLTIFLNFPSLHPSMGTREVHWHPDATKGTEKEREREGEREREREIRRTN